MTENDDTSEWILRRTIQFERYQLQLNSSSPGSGEFRRYAHPEISPMRSLDDSHELHPWRVILGVLQELPSDEVVRIINLAGLPVDWQLTEDWT